MEDKPNTNPLFTNETILRNSQNAVAGAPSQVIHTGDDEQDLVQYPPAYESSLTLKTESTDSVSRENKRIVDHMLMQGSPKLLSLGRSKSADDSERKKRFKSKATNNLFSANTEEMFLELKRSEANSKRNVDMATAAKLIAEKTLVNAKTKREVQLFRFERMNQKKELKELGYTSEEIDSDL